MSEEPTWDDYLKTYLEPIKDKIGELEKKLEKKLSNIEKYNVNGHSNYNERIENLEISLKSRIVHINKNIEWTREQEGKIEKLENLMELRKEEPRGEVLQTGLVLLQKELSELKVRSAAHTESEDGIRRHTTKNEKEIKELKEQLESLRDNDQAIINTNVLQDHIISHKYYDDRGIPVQGSEAKRINAVLEKQLKKLGEATPYANGHASSASHTDKGCDNCGWYEHGHCKNVEAIVHADGGHICWKPKAESQPPSIPKCKYCGRKMIGYNREWICGHGCTKPALGSVETPSEQDVAGSARQTDYFEKMDINIIKTKIEKFEKDYPMLKVVEKAVLKKWFKWMEEPYFDDQMINERDKDKEKYLKEEKKDV